MNSWKFKAIWWHRVICNNLTDTATTYFYLFCCSERQLKTHLDLPNVQLLAHVGQVIWNDVQQTCWQEDSARKTADQAQDGAVSFCKWRQRKTVQMLLRRSSKISTNANDSPLINWKSAVSGYNTHVKFILPFFCKLSWLWRISNSAGNKSVQWSS